MKQNVKIAKQLIKLAEQIIGGRASIVPEKDENRPEMIQGGYVQLPLDGKHQYPLNKSTMMNCKNKDHLYKYIITNYGEEARYTVRNNICYVCENQDVYNKIFGKSRKPSSIWQDNIQYNLNRTKSEAYIQQKIIDFFDQFSILRQQYSDEISSNINNLRKELINIINNIKYANKEFSDMADVFKRKSTVDNNFNFTWQKNIDDQLNPDKLNQLASFFNTIERENNMIGVFSVFAERLFSMNIKTLSFNKENFAQIKHKFIDGITRTIRIKIGKNPGDRQIVDAIISNAKKNILLQTKKNMEKLGEGFQKLHVFIADSQDVVKAFTELNMEHVQQLISIGQQKREELLKGNGKLIRNVKTAGLYDSLKNLWNKINNIIKNIYIKIKNIFSLLKQNSEKIDNEITNLQNINNNNNEYFINSLESLMKELEQ